MSAPLIDNERFTIGSVQETIMNRSRCWDEGNLPLTRNNISNQGELQNVVENNQLEEIDLGFREPCSTSDDSGKSRATLNRNHPACFDDIVSPHLPPYPHDFDNFLSGKKPLRQTIMNQRNRRLLFPSEDYFLDYIEDRLVFWRPSDSQYNIEETITGKHPYQQDINGRGNSLDKSAFGNLMSYFYNHGTEIKDLEKQNIKKEQSEDNRNIKKDSVNYKNIQSWRDRYPITPDIFNLLKSTEFKPSSSKSIILQPSQNNRFTSKEPLPMNDPRYTARGIPIWDFEINFEKCSQREFKEYFYAHDSSHIMNSMDQDVRDLIDGVDNFVIDCFTTTLNTCKSIYLYCQNLF